MRVFNTYLYEIQKGTKPVALVTCGVNLHDEILTKLKKSNISYSVQKVSENKMNIFFGKKECIDVIDTHLSKPLDALNPFEDFILGAILGYDISLQCKRLLQKTSKSLSCV